MAASTCYSSGTGTTVEQRWRGDVSPALEVTLESVTGPLHGDQARGFTCTRIHVRNQCVHTLVSPTDAMVQTYSRPDCSGKGEAASCNNVSVDLRQEQDRVAHTAPKIPFRSGATTQPSQLQFWGCKRVLIHTVTGHLTSRGTRQCSSAQSQVMAKNQCKSAILYGQLLARVVKYRTGWSTVLVELT